MHFSAPTRPIFTGFGSRDLYLIPKVKIALKGTHFKSGDEVKSKTAELLNSVSADCLQHCFEQWKIRMQR
jgi:hypothetical protein